MAGKCSLLVLSSVLSAASTSGAFYRLQGCGFDSPEQGVSMLVPWLKGISAGPWAMSVHAITTPLPYFYYAITMTLPHHYHAITTPSSQGYHHFDSQGSAWSGVFLPAISLWCHHAQLNSRSTLLRMYSVAGDYDSVQTDRLVDRQSEHVLSLLYSPLPFFCMQLQYHDILYQKNITRLCTRTSLVLLPPVCECVCILYLI